MKRFAQLTSAMLLAIAPRLAAAQEAPAPVDIEVPMVVVDIVGSDGAGGESDDSLDLANVVQSAAKGVTTVQEAPVIVTVLTADEIRDRHFQTLDQVIDTVPGFERVGILHSQFTSNAARGIPQSLQFLHDSMSLFDPFLNIPSTTRIQPLETIKRIEVITGPGGVLWGANSFLGVVNVITKDADDINGDEQEDGEPVGEEGPAGEPGVVDEAGAPDEEQAQLLQITPVTPLLSVERIAYTYNDVPMELRRGLYRTDTHHYHNTLN